METNTRTFLKNFASFKAKARAGQQIRVKDRDCVYVFSFRAKNPIGLIGRVKGVMQTDDRMDSPTLAPGEWKPDL